MLDRRAWPNIERRPNLRADSALTPARARMELTCASLYFPILHLGARRDHQPANGMPTEHCSRSRAVAPAHAAVAGAAIRSLLAAARAALGSRERSPRRGGMAPHCPACAARRCDRSRTEGDPEKSGDGTALVSKDVYWSNGKARWRAPAALGWSMMDDPSRA